MSTLRQDFYHAIRAVLIEARAYTARAVNTAMVVAYWEIGRLLVEEEQQGQRRAEYGTQLLALLSERLTAEFGKGFDASNLRYMRLFYQSFPIRDALRHNLSWTHYRLLSKVAKPEARAFYEEECATQNWSTRELERQITTLTYERLLLSRDKQGALHDQRAAAEHYTPADFIKDPYVLEFLGLKDVPKLTESQLESGLIEHLQEFMLELGKGFSFVARQQRLTIDGDHFYIDLVFYNRFLRCFVLVDLKLGKLTHQDLGQMQFYVNYYTRELRQEWESPAIGIVMCAQKNDAVVRYTLPDGEQRVLAAQYQMHLPTEEELAAELRRQQSAHNLLAGLSKESELGEEQ